MKLRRAFATGCVMVALLCLSVTARAEDEGYLTGVVLDPGGTPQMGATVRLKAPPAEQDSARLLTDQNGVFESKGLRPGLYSIEVTLAGFLPTIESVQVSSNVTTLVRIEMDSLFSSLGQLRRRPPQPTERDDWKWVLRTAAANRPILQMLDGTIVVANHPGTEDPSADQARTRIEMTSGALRPGSSSGLPGSPATGVSYDQTLGSVGRLLMAGEMSYGDGGGAGLGFASIWLPTGQLGVGPQTTVVIRQAPLDPAGDSVRHFRVDHSEQLAFGDRVMIDFGAEYVMTAMERIGSALRPHGRVSMEISPEWRAMFVVESGPASYALRRRGAALESALDLIDSLPVLIWNKQNGSGAIKGAWHKEISVRRTLGDLGSVEAAAFHDSTRHQAVFGFDLEPGASFPQPLARAYAHDGGKDGSWGTRVVYREEMADGLEVSAMYAWAGALAPSGEPMSAATELRDALQTKHRHSVAARVAGTVPKTHTQIAASYKWVDGVVVSRQDSFGEASQGVDPNLSLSVRQPLPCFGTSGHWEALADFRNLLSQGYVTMEGPDGLTLLAPVLRSFRGGVSFQF